MYGLYLSASDSSRWYLSFLYLFKANSSLSAQVLKISSLRNKRSRTKSTF